MAKLDSDKVNAAAEAAMARTRNRGGGAPDDDDDDSGLEPSGEQEVVEVSDDDDDDEAEAGSPEQRETAKDRKRARGQRFREETEERIRLAEEKAARAEETVRSLAPLLQNALAPQHQPQDQGIPEDAELDALHEDWRAREEAYALKWHGKQIPPEELAKAHQLAKQFRVQENEIMNRRFQRVHGGGGGLTARDAELISLRAPIRDLIEHPNPQVRAEFEAGFKYEVVTKKRQNTQADLYAYADEVRRKFGMLQPQRAKPTRQTQQRLSGQSRGAQSAGEGPVRVRVTDAIKDMAIAAAPHLSEKAAVERWVKRHGRNLASKEGAHGRRVD